MRTSMYTQKHRESIGPLYLDIYGTVICLPARSTNTRGRNVAPQNAGSSALHNKTNRQNGARHALLPDAIEQTSEVIWTFT
ncbi:hypothetical protein FRC02_004851, partial [Tulasnella sp. 418]